MGDFNEDGIVDAIVSPTYGQPAARGPAPARKWRRHVRPACVLPRALTAAVGDFDRDGNLDVVTANDNNGNVAVLYGNGAGGFPRVTSIPTGLEMPAAISSANLTGDAFLDVVVGIDDLEGVAYCFAMTARRSPRAGSAAVGFARDSIDLDDFNRDGSVDIVTGNQADNTISILSNNGAGVFTETACLTVSGALGVADVGDLNGDGRPDIAIGRAVAGGGASASSSAPRPGIHRSGGHRSGLSGAYMTAPRLTSPATGSVTWSPGLATHRP